LYLMNPMYSISQWCICLSLVSTISASPEEEGVFILENVLFFYEVYLTMTVPLLAINLWSPPWIGW